MWPATSEQVHHYTMLFRFVEDLTISSLGIVNFGIFSIKWNTDFISNPNNMKASLIGCHNTIFVYKLKGNSMKVYNTSWSTLLNNFLESNSFCFSYFWRIKFPKWLRCVALRCVVLHTNYLNDCCGITVEKKSLVSRFINKD